MDSQTRFYKLTDLQNWGVEDILIASVDGLTVFPEAIASIYPHTEVQLCIVHQIRNSLRYVASKNHKAFLADLKRVYRATSLGEGEAALDELESVWGEKYPIVIKSWRSKWEHLSAYFKYPEDIRRIIYTTNSIEAVHRQFRKLTKTKGGFPNDDSLLKLLYMASSMPARSGPCRSRTGISRCRSWRSSSRVGLMPCSIFDLINYATSR